MATPLHTSHPDKVLPVVRKEILAFPNTQSLSCTIHFHCVAPLAR
jgi:hypothetical protein